MNKTYQEYLKESKNYEVAKKYAAPSTARHKKIGIDISHKAEFYREWRVENLMNKAFDNKHSAYLGKSDVYVCVICLKPVGKSTRSRQKSKLIIGKGYSGLLCTSHLRKETLYNS